MSSETPVHPDADQQPALELEPELNPPVPPQAPPTAPPEPRVPEPRAAEPSAARVAHARRELLSVAWRHRASAAATLALALVCSAAALVSLTFCVTYLYLNMLASASQGGGFLWLVKAQEYYVNNITISVALFVAMQWASCLWIKVPKVPPLRASLTADNGEPVMDPPPGARWGSLRTETDLNAGRLFAMVLFAWSMSAREAWREWRQARRVAKSDPAPVAAVINQLMCHEGFVGLTQLADRLGSDCLLAALPTLYELPDVIFRFADPQALQLSEAARENWLNAEVE